MYISPINLMDNQGEILEFIQRFSFATIISTKENAPIATHLPFVAELNNNTLLLTSHFAKANDHWQYIENQKVLVIFSEPHAYISPQNYDTKLNVPTWNYIAIHIYGQAELVLEEEKIGRILEKTINSYESAYQQQWENLPEDYRQRLQNGIVAFEINVSDIKAKKKLSQNRTENEKNTIINSLSKSEDHNENLIAKYMKKEII